MAELKRAVIANILQWGRLAMAKQKIMRIGKKCQCYKVEW